MHSQTDESVMIAMQRSKDNIWTKVHHNSSVMGTQKILAEVALTYICKRICHWKTRQTHLKAKKVQPHRGSTYIFLQMDLKRKTMSDRSRSKKSATWGSTYLNLWRDLTRKTMSNTSKRQLSATWNSTYVDLQADLTKKVYVRHIQKPKKCNLR